MENKRQIVNIVNFIRGYNSEMKPWGETYRTVKNQIDLIDKYNFKATFLIQYDALTFAWYKKLMNSLDKDRYEIGVWFEIHQPLAESCGLKWRGERKWDGHVQCGFSMGYSNEEKKLLLDKLFEQFKKVMGYYPRVFGSWFFDSFTARYVSEKYGIDAFCNCKEQYGTDGYTLWGSYYGQAYYPSLKNVFIPAQSKENQLDVPLFRMLGSDQVYQYDYGMNEDSSARKAQSVITLEPVYFRAGGGLPAWVDWYMKENFNGECLSFGYAQAGQENSFGWNKMKTGLRYQFELFSKLQKEGKIEIETLGESGKWFKNTYTETPASAITAHTAFDDDKKSSVWFCNKNYRINIYSEDNVLRIRDFHIFDENIEDPFEHVVCKENYAVYETLPLVDGFLYSGNHIRSGIYFTDKNTDEKILCEKMDFEETESGCKITYQSEKGNTIFNIYENGFEVSREEAFIASNIIGRECEFLPDVKKQSEDTLCLEYKGTEYSVKLKSGCFSSATEINSENGIIAIELC